MLCINFVMFEVKFVASLKCTIDVNVSELF